MDGWKDGCMYADNNSGDSCMGSVMLIFMREQ